MDDLHLQSLSQCYTNIWNLWNHSVVKLHEITSTATEASHVREMTAKKCSNCGKYGSLSICSACSVFCFDDLVDSQAQSLLTFFMSGWCGSAIPVLTAALTLVWLSNTCTDSCSGTGVGQQYLYCSDTGVGQQYLYCSDTGVGQQYLY